MLQFSIDVEEFRSLFAGSPLMSPPKALIVLHHVRIDLNGNILSLSITDLVSYYTASTTKASFDEDGSFLLPIAALRKLPRNGNITVTFDGSKVGITDHIITFWSYNTLNVNDYPAIPTPQPNTTSSLDVPNLKWALTEASRICDPVCITNSLRQIAVSKDKVEVTDGELFMRYFIAATPIDFTVPARSLKSFLGALDTDEIEIGNDETLTSLVSPKRVVSFSNFDAPFPSLDGRFNLSVVANLAEIQIDPKDFMNSVRQITLDPENLISISGEAMNVEKITIHCEELESGYSADARFHCTTTAGKFTMTLHSGRLLRMLSAVAEEPKVSLMIGDSSVSFKTPNAQAMLLRRL